MQQVPVPKTKNMLPSKKIKTSSRESLRLMEMLQTSPPPRGGLSGGEVGVLLVRLLGSDCAGVTYEVLCCDQVSTFQVSVAGA